MVLVAKGISPQLWGPSAWRVFHTAAAMAARDPRLYPHARALFLEGLPELLPCRACRRNVREHMARMPPLRGPSGLVRWVYKLHQRVNDALGVPATEQPTYAQAAAMYRRPLAPSEVEPFLSALVATHPGARWLRPEDPYARGLAHLFALLPALVAAPTPAPHPDTLLSRTQLRAWTAEFLKTP